MSSMNDKETVRRSVNNKLRSNAGETISETLVALLISALALVMLAGAISAASSIVTKGRDKLKTYYDNNEKIVNLTEGSKAGSVTITEASTTPGDGVGNSEDGIDILYYENAAFTKNKVIAYRKDPNAGH